MISKRLLQSIVTISILWGGALRSLTAENFIERDGRYEINWTTKKIKFFGVGQLSDQDSSWRAAEQRAWADGLTVGQSELSQIIGTKLGHFDSTPSAASQDAKIQNLAAVTRSISTTYFGDQRVKVVLETPLESVVSNLTGGKPSSEVGSAGKSAPARLTIHLPKNAKPSAFVKIIDEDNHLLASSKSTKMGATWYRTSMGLSSSSATTAAVPEIAGTSAERGVIQVHASDWKPSYAEALTAGAIAVVIQ